MEITELAQLISHGGVVALAVVVWYELRSHRAELKSHREDENKSREMISQLAQATTKAIGDLAAQIGQLLQLDKVQGIIRDEISGVHDQPGRITEDDDTPVDVPRSTEYRQHGKKRPRTNPGTRVGTIEPKARKDREGDD